MKSKFAHPRALVVSGVDINRYLKVRGVLGDLPELPSSPTKRISWESLLGDAEGVVHTGEAADQLRSER